MKLEELNEMKSRSGRDFEEMGYIAYSSRGGYVTDPYYDDRFQVEAKGLQGEEYEAALAAWKQGNREARMDKR